MKEGQIMVQEKNKLYQKDIKFFEDTHFKNKEELEIAAKKLTEEIDRLKNNELISNTVANEYRMRLKRAYDKKIKDANEKSFFEQNINLGDGIFTTKERVLLSEKEDEQLRDMAEEREYNRSLKEIEEELENSYSKEIFDHEDMELENKGLEISTTENESNEIELE